MRDGTWQSMAAYQLRRIESELTAALAGLAEDRLDVPVRGFPNPIGWTAWHISRNIDRNCSELTGRPQQWLEGWADVFGRLADPADTGFGHGAADVSAFRSPSIEVLLGYHAAAHAVAEDYLANASDDDATRLVVSPTLGNTHPVQVRLARSIHDAVAHLGQISVLRHLASRAPSVR